MKVPTADAYSPTESAKIAQMMKTKASVTDMAAAIGRTKASVNSYITQRRTELGYLRKRSTWDERRGVVVQAKQYRQEGEPHPTNADSSLRNPSDLPTRARQA